MNIGYGRRSTGRSSERLKMLKRSIAFALVFATAAIIAPGAFAQSRSGTPEEQKACGRDVSRFCKAVINSDDFTILRCLQSNRPKLSSACNKVLVSHGQ